MGISPLRARRARAGSRRILVEPLEDRRLLTTIVALSEANELLRVDSLRPTTILDRRGVTVRRGDVLVGMHLWETVSLDNIAYILDRDDLTRMDKVTFYIVRGSETLHE